MLTRLQIRDFAIVHEIAVEFADGMTVLTGETGAGKSILVDALGLVLGERGSSQLVRNGAKRAEFSAEFDVSDHPQADQWLQDLAMDEDGVCVVRRIVNSDGRSRAFINGNPVPLGQLKTLGELLLDIHGQHFHQSLGKHSVQRTLLDHYGGLLDDCRQVEDAFRSWNSLRENLATLQQQDADRASRTDLVSFQLDELEQLSLADGEPAELEAERQRLLHSGKLAQGLNQALAALNEDDIANAGSLIAGSIREIENLLSYDPSLQEALELLQSADIQLSEACESLRRYGDGIESDPARQNWVEQRLDAIQSIARKHRVESGELGERLSQLRDEYDALINADEHGRELEEQAATAERYYRELAEALSIKRQTSADQFAAEVTDAMSGLGMPGGVFEVSLQAANEARAWGIDSIEFLISANPGQPPMPLSKVASGGELARMSLAVQVIASDGSAIPTMVFDEVDSGVGGGVAEMLGLRLAELGASRQVLCVTHLPQVASLAHQHLRVSKVSDDKTTRTSINELSQQERIEELARMLGGVEITKTTLAHAAEMLSEADQKRA